MPEPYNGHNDIFFWANKKSTSPACSPPGIIRMASMTSWIPKQVWCQQAKLTLQMCPRIFIFKPFPAHRPAPFITSNLEATIFAAVCFTVFTQAYIFLSLLQRSGRAHHTSTWLIPSPYCPPFQSASWEIYSCAVLSQTSCFRRVVPLLLTHKDDTEAVLTSAEYNSIRAPICCRVPLQLYSVV